MKIQRWNKVIAIFLVFLLLGNLIPQSVSASGNDSNVTELTESMEDSEPSDYEDVSNELQNDNDTEATILCELVEKREENVKHFLMSNNAIQAVMYSEPVHYKEGGEWKNIDNTLTLENALEKEDFKGYKNKNNSFSVKIASEVQDSNLVSIKKDKYKLSFNLISDKKSNKVVGKKKNTKDKGVDKESKLIEDINTESDQIIFYNIKDSVDIEYQVTSKGVKENIIINERQSQYEYIYNITTQNLELKLKGNEILAYAEDTQELIYKIPAPFMYDSNNNFSTDVIYNLTKSQKGYIFEIVPNSDWLNDVDRAFPVVIDPIITTETKKSTIDSTFISSSKATTNFYEYLMLLIGVETSAYGKCRTLLKFDLPELNPGDIIVNARLNLLQYQISSYSASNPDMPINAYMVTSDWTASGVSWSTMPSYSSTILDFSYMSRNDAVCWKGFDITKAVKAWYDGGSGNNGIMLAANQESGANSEVAMVARYWSEKYNQETDAYPLIYLEYRNTKGIEDYYSYSEINAGDLGDLFINNYTGNMTLLESGVSTSGQRAPANVSVVYNTTSSDKVLKNTMPYCGYGWKLNIQQFVKKSTEYGLTGTAATNYPYVYIDEDGTEHYFMKVIKDSKTLYYDEDGLGLELTINSSSTNEYYVITDAKDGKMNFDKNGNLQTIIDANNNKITINYNSAGTAIESITDGAGKIIKIGRTSDGYLSTIIDPANRATAYTISSNKLVKITYPDNTYSTISYDSNIQNIIISSVVCPNKLRYDFKYSSAKEGKRVVFINEYSVKDSATTAAGQIMLFDYSKYNTTIKRTARL